MASPFTFATATCCSVVRLVGATENAGVENAIRSKLQGWKMQEWKKREHTARLENAGVEKAGVSRYGKPNKEINRVAAHILNVTQLSALHEALQCYL